MVAGESSWSRSGVVAVSMPGMPIPPEECDHEDEGRVEHARVRCDPGANAGQHRCRLLAAHEHEYYRDEDRKGPDEAECGEDDGIGGAAETREAHIEGGDDRARQVDGIEHEDADAEEQAAGRGEGLDRPQPSGQLWRRLGHVGRRARVGHGDGARVTLSIDVDGAQYQHEREDEPHGGHPIGRSAARLQVEQPQNGIARTHSDRDAEHPAQREEHPRHASLPGQQNGHERHDGERAHDDAERERKQRQNEVAHASSFRRWSQCGPLERLPPPQIRPVEHD